MMRRLGRWASIAVITLAAGSATYLVSREFLAPEKAALSPIQPAVIPELRPDVELADREGKLRSLSEWNGRPTIINFWATWCAPCRREIPLLNALARDKAYSEFAVIGIAIDFREDVLRYLVGTPIDYTVLIGEQGGLDAARAFGMESIGLPFTVFTDKTGRIATIHIGELHRPQAEVILAAVQAVDSGQTTIKAARDRIRADLPKID